MTLRRALDALYDGAGVVAGVALIGTLVFVLIGIGGRLAHFHLPGTDAYAGYCMAAAGFLALAHTLKRGEHIRVTLIVEHLSPARRRTLEITALAIATLLAALFAFYSVRLAFQSWQFNDVSTANDATPLWLPQLAMAAGTLTLFVAVVDELVAGIRGRRRKPAAEAALHNE
jgi:TRAP-type C4-dicarboxylate transport system permease small subunit